MQWEDADRSAVAFYVERRSVLIGGRLVTPCQEVLGGLVFVKGMCPTKVTTHCSDWLFDYGN